MAPNETNKSYADKLEFKQDYLSQEKTDLNFLIVTWVSSDQAKKFSLGLHGLWRIEKSPYSVLGPVQHNLVPRTFPLEIAASPPCTLRQRNLNEQFYFYG